MAFCCFCRDDSSYVDKAEIALKELQIDLSNKNFEALPSGVEMVEMHICEDTNLCELLLLPIQIRMHSSLSLLKKRSRGHIEFDYFEHDRCVFHL